MPISLSSIRPVGQGQRNQALFRLAAWMRHKTPAGLRPWQRTVLVTVLFDKVAYQQKRVLFYSSTAGSRGVAK